MAGSAFKDADLVAAVTRDFVPVLVNMRASTEIATTHGITSTPTVVYQAPDDPEPIGFTVNRQSAEVLMADMEKALADLAEIRALLEEMEEE